jgi:acetyl-CoA acetyltransferase
MSQMALITTCDRTSNGPHVVYPSPAGPGGTVGHENPVWDNMQCDPLGGHSMLATAENVAKKYSVSTKEQHEVVLRRTEQYAAALANDRAFQKGYLTLGMEIPSPDFRKTVGVLEGDEGVTNSTPEGLARLKPVMAGGTVTYGGQTHPADGNVSIILATADRARELSRDPNIRITLEGFGLARAPLAFMPEAPVPAARRALENAGVDIKQIDVVKSHNPFAVNDIVFSRETGFDLMAMNNFGCSLIWGHPNGPTGMRGIIEMIEELVMRGGGLGLFQGCAAGDTAMATVIKVTGKR